MRQLQHERDVALHRHHDLQERFDRVFAETEGVKRQCFRMHMMHTKLLATKHFEKALTKPARRVQLANFREIQHFTQKNADFRKGASEIRNFLYRKAKVILGRCFSRW